MPLGEARGWGAYVLQFRSSSCSVCQGISVFCNRVSSVLDGSCSPDLWCWVQSLAYATGVRGSMPPVVGVLCCPFLFFSAVFFPSFLFFPPSASVSDFPSDGIGWWPPLAPSPRLQFPFFPQPLLFPARCLQLDVLWQEASPQSLAVQNC